MRLPVYLTLGVVVSVVCIYMANQKMRCVYTPERKARQEIAELSTALIQMSIESPTNLKEQTYSGKELYGLLNTNGFHVVIAGHPAWVSEGRIMDPWNMDYRARIALATDTRSNSIMRVQVESAGPNRAFDNGKDDIFQTVDSAPR